MRKLNLVEEGLLPLDMLMDEEVVSVMGGFNPNDFNVGCNCECNCDVDDFCEAGMPNN